jgi:hypothetical protein
MTATTSPPARRRLSGTARTLLFVLRVYVILAVPLVAFTFFHSLRP